MLERHATKGRLVVCRGQASDPPLEEGGRGDRALGDRDPARAGQPDPVPRAPQRCLEAHRRRRPTCRAAGRLLDRKRAARFRSSGVVLHLSLPPTGGRVPRVSRAGSALFSCRLPSTLPMPLCRRIEDARSRRDRRSRSEHGGNENGARHQHEARKRPRRRGPHRPPDGLGQPVPDRRTRRPGGRHRPLPPRSCGAASRPARSRWRTSPRSRAGLWRAGARPSRATATCSSAPPDWAASHLRNRA